MGRAVATVQVSCDLFYVLQLATCHFPAVRWLLPYGGMRDVVESAPCSNGSSLAFATDFFTKWLLPCLASCWHRTSGHMIAANVLSEESQLEERLCVSVEKSGRQQSVTDFSSQLVVALPTM